MENKTTAKEPGALATLFTQEYLHAKSLYLYLTGKIPSVAFINEIDPFDAVNAFRIKYEKNIETGITMLSGTMIQGLLHL
jgi:hypothetical protein